MSDPPLTRYRLSTTAPFPELQALYDFRDEVIYRITEHRNATYFPRITVYENTVMYDPEYIPPIELRNALRWANEDIERAYAEMQARRGSRRHRRRTEEGPR